MRNGGGAKPVKIVRIPDPVLLRKAVAVSEEQRLSS
jgi:hypothetical protein